MYKVYFDDRFIIIDSVINSDNLKKNEKFICYKNKKSFYKAVKEFKKDTNILKFHVQTQNSLKILKLLKKKFKTINAAGGLVFNTEGFVLMIKRNGVWDLPKGKIEKGEKSPEAAIREVEEECGITGLLIERKIGRTYHTYLFRQKNMFKTTHWFLMKYEGNELLIPQTEEDITEVKWKRPEEVKNIIPNTYKSLTDILMQVKY